MDALLEHFGYLAVVALHVAGGVGVPLPKERVPYRTVLLADALSGLVSVPIAGLGFLFSRHVLQVEHDMRVVQGVIVAVVVVAAALTWVRARRRPVQAR
jgi:membrane protein DedA with SNARE-associated domain